jgi:diguanylate cyclase (GGDEF)-like protein/PAS domain S-box-containing protein
MSFLANLNCARMSDQDEQSMLRVTLEDITMIKKSEADLRVAAIAFESHDGLMITDAENKILKVNRAFTKITGYTDEEVVGKSPSMLASGRHDAAFFAEMWGSLNKTGRWTGEVWNRRKSGDVYPENLTITAVKGEKGIITNYVATFTDISMMKAAAEEIQQLAFFDSLTQLPNRRLLMDRLKHAIAAGARSGRQGAVLFLDLDHFKVLNDSLGHDIGDLLLQQVAERLTACVREGDTVARLGGDEYVVVLEDLSEQDLEAAAQTETIANKILASLNQPYQLDAHEHHITPSIGIAVFKNHHSTIEELLKQADIAMYQAKKAGRNTLRFFNPQMQISITARVALERELRKALDNKQLHLYYQIQVDNSGHALGAEALIRWIHPERGLVSPAQFIPLAEETGLILPIGNWVLNTACAQIKAWHKNAHTRDLTLSINVSAKQFRQPDFVAQVRAAIERHSIDPMQLKIELTESLLLENVEDTIASMTALGEIGVQFSLDDFGTGYSSLQYLKRLPLFQLKIDQSFVRDIVTDSHDRSIVRTIIAMAQSLYLNVIAEGVETEQQRELLLSNGCKRYQGYMFGKPVPINEFNAALKQDN